MVPILSQLFSNLWTSTCSTRKRLWIISFLTHKKTLKKHEVATTTAGTSSHGAHIDFSSRPAVRTGGADRATQILAEVFDVRCKPLNGCLGQGDNMSMWQRLSKHQNGMVFGPMDVKGWGVESSLGKETSTYSTNHGNMYTVSEITNTSPNRPSTRIVDGQMAAHFVYMNSREFKGLLQVFP
jgi:hypothetical protein